MDLAKRRLRKDAKSLNEISAALEWIGSVANSNEPGTGDEALANSATLKSVAEFVTKVSESIE